MLRVRIHITWHVTVSHSTRPEHSLNHTAVRALNFALWRACNYLLRIYFTLQLISPSYIQYSHEYFFTNIYCNVIVTYLQLVHRVVECFRSFLFFVFWKFFFIPTKTKPPAPKDDNKNESGTHSSVIVTSKFAGQRQKSVPFFVLICL